MPPSTLSKAQSISLEPGDTRQLTTGTHLEYALLQYWKASRGMRSSLTQKSLDRRKLLIGTLVSFRFESLQGITIYASKYAGYVLNLIRSSDSMEG